MLYRKMFRDIKNNFQQFLTIFLMILIGIMAYSGIEAYMQGMKDTANKFYKENNLFDLNVEGTLTDTDLDKIKMLPHIKNAEGKLSLTGETNNKKTLLINIIETNNISKFYIVDGQNFNYKKDGVYLDEYYAKENNIKVGDTILVKYNNIKLNKKVLALINVPDHVYDTKDSSVIFPNRKEFGFAYLSFNNIPVNNKVYNNIMIDVDKTKNIEKVKEELENNIGASLVVTKREDTTSYRTYQGEIDEGKTYVGVFSTLFIIIALLSCITTMTRLIKKERTQIGTLKALGFSNIKILFHYIAYSMFISIIGVIFGLILGYNLLGRLFISLEMSVFEIPNGHPTMTTSSYIVSLIVILLISLITYSSGKTILVENAADTLRNKAPSTNKSNIKLNSKLSPETKWNIRDILRNKTRTIMAIIGLASSTTLIICAKGMMDTMNNYIKIQFRDLYNFKYELTLNKEIDENTLNKLKEKYGNNTKETLPIEIKKNNKKESNNIVVDSSNNKLRYIDTNNKYIKLNNNGVYITRKLAKNNNYKIGDNITWHIYGNNKYYTSKIIGFNIDPQNQNITMTKEYLESLNIKYHADTLYTNKDLSKVKTIEGVDKIQNKTDLKNSMENMLSMMKSMVLLIIFIAIILSIVIIYNLGILSYTENTYQFATLKVLGFSNKQIEGIFIKQINWISLASSLIGIPLGYLLTDYLFKYSIEKHYDYRAYINIETYIIGVIMTILLSYIVSKLLSKKIEKIDMVSSLKSTE